MENNYKPEPEVVRLIVDYMNSTQLESVLKIAKTLRPEAVAAVLNGLDKTGIQLLITNTHGEPTQSSIPWPGPLRARENIRQYLFELSEG